MRLIFDDKIKQSDVNVVYSDKCLHVRFKNNFKRVEGFENKLTYLLTHYMSQLIEEDSIDFSLEFNKGNAQYIWNKYISRLKNSAQYAHLISAIKKVIVFKDIKFMPKYQADSLLSMFAYHLDLHEFNVSDENFLLDDRYSLDFSDSFGDPYRKFKKKQLKKLNRKNNAGKEEINLWLI